MEWAAGSDWRQRRGAAGAGGELQLSAGSIASHADLAAQLWTTDYVGLFMSELEEFSDISALLLALVGGLRERRRADLAEDRAALLRLAAVCSSLARERSQKLVPFSVAARSISWLMQRVATRVWADQQRRKEVVHKVVCNKLLDRMLECRPPPSFLVSRLINFVYGDQTYKQRGSTRRAERLEYIGRNGLPLNIEREVVFNSIHLPVPQVLLPQLDAQAVASISASQTSRTTTTRTRSLFSWRRQSP